MYNKINNLLKFFKNKKNLENYQILHLRDCKTSIEKIENLIANLIFLAILALKKNKEYKKIKDEIQQTIDELNVYENKLDYIIKIFSTKLINKIDSYWQIQNSYKQYLFYADNTGYSSEIKKDIQLICNDVIIDFLECLYFESIKLFKFLNSTQEHTDEKLDQLIKDFLLFQK